MATNTATEDKPTVTVKDMKHLLALILDDTVKDEEKLSFEKAKTIIDLLITPSEDSGDQQPTETKTKREQVIDPKLKDNVRMEDLGLGRGVDATKPYPWQNKSSYQVRTITTDCANIIGTEESGQRRYYEGEVNSVLTQQLNTKLTIKEPSNSLAIGIDAEGSRSFTDTRKAVGEKVMTRTVSFRTNFDEQDTLEKDLSKFVLKRLQTKEKWDKKREGGLRLEGEPDDDNALQYLREFIDKLDKESDELWLVLQYCYDFIEYLGITHYVHTIKLGAATYRVLTTEEYYLKFDLQSGFEVNKVAKAELRASGGHTKKNTHTSTKVNTIGTIKDSDHTVKWVSPDEAVLEVELKPLHSLIRTRSLQLAMKWALERYIKRRESRREGPFLISCGSEDKPIYWLVADSKVMGTTKIEEASLFYVIQTDDGRHPNEFFIGYVGDEMANLELPKGPANPISKVKPLAPTPKYVEADLDMWGRCEGPLEVSAGAYRNRAQFTLHSSALREYAVLRTSVDTGKWAEGGGFFINCARRWFKRDGYIAMEKVKEPRGKEKNDLEMTEQSSPKAVAPFKTTCLTSVTDHSSEGPWMVFRLLPGEHKMLNNKPLKRVVFERGDLTKPLIDVGSNPTYLSDERDFQYLFGDLEAKSKVRDESAATELHVGSSGKKAAASVTHQQSTTTAEIHESPA